MTEELVMQDDGSVIDRFTYPNLTIDFNYSSVDDFYFGAQREECGRMFSQLLMLD